MTEQGWMRRKGDRRRIVVVGAGVAGMTCAHELVERGYEVEVVEMTPDPCGGTAPRIGGMARTAWARVPSSAAQAPLWHTTPAYAPGASPPQRSRAGQRLDADRAPYPLTVSLAVLDPAGHPDDTGRLDAFLRALVTPTPLLVIASLSLDPGQETRLRTLLGNHPYQLTVAEAGAAEPRMQLSVAGARVPGEHGFRFFPSFYHHLFDTMKRIPIPEAAIVDRASEVVRGVALVSDSFFSVFDALLSAEVIQLGLEPDERGARTLEIPRRTMRSPHEVRRLFRDVLERAGYRGQDLHRLVTRYAEYLTSSPERRMDYERISWSEFLGLGGGGYSPAFVRHVHSGAQALVAMSSDSNDARTIGSIAMQLTLDQVRGNPGGYTDATLRGPTSTELFDPWRVYLESQSVKFTCARLVGFTGRGMAVRPVFARPAPPTVDDPAATAGDPDARAAGPVAPADYYVITIPVDKFQALFEADGRPRVPPAAAIASGRLPPLLSRGELCDANRDCLALDRLERGYPADPPGERSDDVAKYLEFELGDVTGSPDRGPLRYMCGVQFYFESDVKILLGHTVCLDSPWGVSHISQVQYWQDRSRGQSGMRGVISAIFTLFEVPAPDFTGQNARTALACSPDEIAERVWKQIVDAWDTERHGRLPDPGHFYLDESLTHVDGTWSNATPYLVNCVGDWPRRGGLRTSPRDYEYRVQLGHTVFAGAFMRTHTRLNTMEAANESGRRAANAILAYDGAKVQPVALRPLEDHELPEVAPLRDLDRRIARRGGHHILRHAGVEAALRTVPWDLIRLFLPTGDER
jgi:uncharacterized protein with NAD-binding domain and iron-sulfur cluster